MAASPIIAVLLAVVLGAVTKSWFVGLGNTTPVMFWVVWFRGASNYSTSDCLVWAFIVALGLHSLVIMWFIVLQIFRRVRVPNVA